MKTLHLSIIIGSIIVIGIFSITLISSSKTIPTNIQETPVTIYPASYSQVQAIQFVEDDLKTRLNHSRGIKNIMAVENGIEKYIPLSEFLGKNETLPLVFINPNGTLYQVNDGKPRISGTCTDPTKNYCAIMPPLNLWLQNHLVWGLDITYWLDDSDQKTAFYAIDAGTGMIVDSPFVRDELVQKKYIDSIPLDFSQAESKNPLGIKGQVIIKQDTMLSPVRQYPIPPTPHLGLTAEKGTQFIGYEVCDGQSCKKDRLTDGLYVWLDNISQNYSGTNAIMIGDINLGDMPWKENDTVHIKVMAFPASLLQNNIVVRHAENTMTIDLGESKIKVRK